MPSGYTAGVADGTVTSFREYASRCMRAFGALIDMRDDPSTTPIPDEVVPSDYYAKEVAETEGRIAALCAMTEAEVAAAWEADCLSRNNEYERRAAERDETELRYRRMLELARRFVPPTFNHGDFSKFLVRQLEESLRFDCSTINRPTLPQTANEWRDGEIERERRWLESCKKSQQEEIQRCADRTAWIRAAKAAIAAVEQ